MMSCDEFELHGLDIERVDADPLQAAAAAEHVKFCPHCSAMLESWREVQRDLRLLREATQVDSAPARVEMRLRQELRTRREARVPRGTVVVASWALAAAAALVAAIGWMKTHDRTTGRDGADGRTVRSASVSPGTSAIQSKDKIVSSPVTEDTVRAEATKPSPKSTHSDAGDTENGGKFTLLPGSLPSETEEAAIVRVRMQRGALGALGLPVNEERAGEWIQVDLLVGNDGLPQAVRLAR
jgi:hypothetical protein